MSIYEKVSKCYDSLADEVSKEIFTNRLAWNLSGDCRYLEAIVDYLSPKLKELGLANSNNFQKSFHYISEKLDRENCHIVVYGLGMYGKEFVENFEHKQKLIICDTNVSKEIKEYKGIKVISREELFKDYADRKIIVTTLKYEDEIVDELVQDGMPKEQIVRLSDHSRIFDVDEYSQYFEEGIVEPGKNEVFVDCGFFEGETTKRFVEWCGRNYEQIYAFEPNKHNIAEAIRKNDINRINNLNIINKGVWEDTRNLNLMVTDRGDSCYICEEGNETIQVTSIDDVLNGNRATFIKMDVEGSELKALHGARITIEKYRPRLAICIYHKPEDIVEIQDYISSLDSNYKFYIRQYSNYSNELVLYAV